VYSCKGLKGDVTDFNTVAQDVKGFEVRSMPF
jgi:hypothetical protein